MSHRALRSLLLFALVAFAAATPPLVGQPTATILSNLADDPNPSLFGEDPFALFGYSVATAGDVNGDGFSDVLVGAPEFAGNGKSGGLAALYLGSPDGLEEDPHWRILGAHAGARLGESVATAGDVNCDGYSDVVVGASGTANPNGSQAGALYVYFGSARGLEDKSSLEAADFTVSGSSVGDRFGFSVASAGDVDGNGCSEVLAGAPGTFGNKGWALLFYGNEDGLSVARHWRVAGTAKGQELGYSVAMAGDVDGDGFGDVILGAPGAGVGGKAALFRGSSSGLLETNPYPGLGQVHATLADADWESPDVGSARARTGHSVATAGDVNGDGYADLAIGAPLHESANSGEVGEGLVLVYYGGAHGPRHDFADWGYGCSCSSLRSLGRSVATAGDLNADGYADLAVAVPDASNIPDYPLGRAYVWFGSKSGLAVKPHPEFTYLGAEPDWQRTFLGGAAGVVTSVATAGDTQGDGSSDLLVGAPLLDVSGSPAGAALIFAGQPGGPSRYTDWQQRGGDFNRTLGHSVASAGDVNGDGFADAILGAPYFGSATVPAFGRVVVYHGSANGLSDTPDWICVGTTSNGNFGWSVASAGDVNNDGYDDVIVGERVWSFAVGTLDQLSAAGRALVFYGSRYGLEKTYAQLQPGDPQCTSDDANWMVVGSDSTYLGHTVASAGDTNGDGYDDVVIGSQVVGPHLFFGSRDGLPTDNGSLYGPNAISYTDADWSPSDGPPGSQFGIAVASAGDVNRDGYADVVVGAPFFDAGGFRRGTAFVYLGGPGGPPTTASWQPEWGWAHELPFTGVTDPEIVARLPHQDLGLVGYSVATAGDLNGDGFADLVLGAPSLPYNQTTGPGVVYVFFGSEAGLYDRPAFWIPHIHSGSSFGYSVASGGDTNGDGLADLVVGAPGAISAQEIHSPLAATGPGIGAAFLYRGFAMDAKLFDAYVAMDHRVWPLASVLDHPDGADWWLGSLPFETANGGTEPEPDRDTFIAMLGSSVAGAGDTNGDGYADLIFGAPHTSVTHALEGAAYLHYGNGDNGGGVPLRPMQLQHDTKDAPISDLGGIADGLFDLRLRGWSPYGRGEVVLEWEVDPLGRLLTGSHPGFGDTWENKLGGPRLRETADIDRFGPGVFHWRVRVHYNPATTPFQSFGPWVSPPWNGVQEGDLRVLEPTHWWKP